jgi:hypothetical protein
MKSRSAAQLEAERQAVRARAAKGCYFERLGVRLIETRADIDAALERALALNVDATTERLLREAHATLVDPVARGIYLIVRHRLAAYGMLPPLRVPRQMELLRYGFSCAWRRLRKRLLGNRPSKPVGPGLPSGPTNLTRNPWANPRPRP